MTKVLHVDDEGEALLSLSRVLKGKEPSFIVEGAGTAARAVEAISRLDPHVVVIDLSLDAKRGVESGFELLQNILGASRRCRVIVLTGHSSIENGVRALNLGAAHFLEKPPDIAHLIALIRDGAQQAEIFRAYEISSQGVNPTLLNQELLGTSDGIEKLRDEVLFAASTNQSVLLAGETGTGKTLCAALIHQFSSRSTGRFVCYTPGFNSADLVNSDLFGHLKGSFTGASESRSGLLQEADGGTFFLDEVDELPQDTQVSLLRAMQSKTFRALGSNKDEQSNFRLITATNLPIEGLVPKGKLREDFYHRVAHKIIRIPALRERKSDIAQLSKSFLQALAKREQVRVYDFDSQAIERLESYNWPGNVRELQAVVEGVAYLAQFKGRTLVMQSDLQLGSGTALLAGPEERGFHELVETFKRKIVDEAMVKVNGNQAQAAKLLGLDRSSLRRILGKE